MANKYYSKRQRRKYRPKGISRRKRKLIERDGPYCVCCKIELENLQIHHIKKRCDGGSNDLDNLALLCRFCHVIMHQNEPKIPYNKTPYQVFWKWCEQMRKYLHHFLGATYEWNLLNY